MKYGHTITELQNQVFSKIINNSDIVKALIVDNANFINVTPTSQQQELLNNPQLLIRQQIFPYRKVTLAAENAKSYITSAWIDFKKSGGSLSSGIVYFYIIVPLSLEKTVYGIRYNYIADKLDDMFTEKNNIGEFEFNSRGDIDVPDGYIGHHISFRIVDFKMNVGDISV